MLCKFCHNEYNGYKTSKYCSLECKKESILNSKRKYNNKFKKNIDFNLIENIENEEWKKIDDYNYYISNEGRVLGKNGLMKPNENSNGYLYVTLCKNGLHKSFTIHRLVALYFIDNNDKDNLCIIDHIDRNRKNNKLSNLRWVDYKTNANNSSNVLFKGCSKWVDKCIKNSIEYIYYRVQYYDNGIAKRKRFKTEEEANNFINEYQC